MPFAGLDSHRTFAGARWRALDSAVGVEEAREDPVAEETPVALLYDGVPHVVMMASPVDLEDFALGFSLSEGLLEHPGQLERIEVLAHPEGMAVQLTCAPGALPDLTARRRNLTGRTGCGLCGAETLAQAVRAPRRVPEGGRLAPAALQRALAGLSAAQPLNAVTGAVHAAAWCASSGEIVLVREDVGRHNALDKLIGALARAGTDLADGFLLLTSRASYELVLKASMVGMRVVVAVSAPTGLAIRMADEAGITLAAFARPGRHTVYTHGGRLAE